MSFKICFGVLGLQQSLWAFFPSWSSAVFSVLSIFQSLDSELVHCALGLFTKCEAMALQAHLACGNFLSSIVEWEDRSPTLRACWGTRQGDVGRLNLKILCPQMFDSLELRIQRNLGMVDGNYKACSGGTQRCPFLVSGDHLCGCGRISESQKIALKNPQWVHS